MADIRLKIPVRKHTICPSGVLYRSKSVARSQNKEANICGIAVMVVETAVGGLSSCCCSSAAAIMAAAIMAAATAAAVAATTTRAAVAAAADRQ